MLAVRKILFITVCLLYTFLTLAQHPNRKKIDSLKTILPSVQGERRIDCLNALSEEYWWEPRVWPDSISYWAYPAHEESLKTNYAFGRSRKLSKKFSYC
jgi:hypothetical protein